MSTDNRPPQRFSSLPTIELTKLREIKLKDYLIRFVLGAVISIGTALIVRSVGVRFGGEFLAFSAILPASLTLLQQKEGTRRADRNAIGAILGGFALAVFALTVEKIILLVEPFVALVLALGMWLVTSLLLYAALAFFRPDDCHKDKD